MSTYQGSPERTKASTSPGRSILPRAHRLNGYEWAYYLVNRRSGRAISITLWESEEAADLLRSESAVAASATVESVERYEVAISPERPLGEIRHTPSGPDEQVTYG